MWLKLFLFKFGLLFVVNIFMVLLFIFSMFMLNVFFLRLNMKMVSFSFTFTSYVNVAAMGFFSNCMMFNFVRCFVCVVVFICKLLKYVGIVIIVLLIVVFNSVFVAFNSVRSTCAFVFFGSIKYFFLFLFIVVIVVNFVLGCGMILYGMFFVCVLYFLYFCLMNRFTLCSALCEFFCIFFFVFMFIVIVLLGLRVMMDGIVWRFWYGMIFVWLLWMMVMVLFVVLRLML